MGIASLVLGIISLIMSFVPFIGIFFALTAIIGIILGIVSLCKKKDKGKSIGGIITSVIAIIITILYVFVIAGIVGSSSIVEKAKKAVEEYDNNEITNSSSSLTSSEKHVTTGRNYSVGEKFQNKDIAITFLSKDENFTGYSKYATIEEGYKIIKAEFEFENVGDSSQYVSSYDFDCYADGYDCDSFWSVENSSFSATLSSGKKTKGTVYFEVPVNSERITLEYDLDYIEDEKVEFVIK